MSKISVCPKKVEMHMKGKRIPYTLADEKATAGIQKKTCR